MVGFASNIRCFGGQSHILNYVILFPADSLGLSPAEEYQLAVRSFGAITWYLSTCFLEQQLLSMRRFEHYLPIDSSESPKLSGLVGRHMVLKVFHHIS